jgi:hypothetical protein
MDVSPRSFGALRMQRAGLLAQKTPHFIKRASTVNNEGFD